MGFAGGGNNIAIATALPPSSFVYCIVNIKHHQNMLSTGQRIFRKGLGTCDALSCLSQTLPSALESRQEARISQIDFNAAFDRVNHQRIL